MTSVDIIRLQLSWEREAEEGNSIFAALFVIDITMSATFSVTLIISLFNAAFWVITQLPPVYANE